VGIRNVDEGENVSFLSYQVGFDVFVTVRQRSVP